jgi:hypothetical protein
MILQMEVDLAKKNLKATTNNYSVTRDNNDVLIDDVVTRDNRDDVMDDVANVGMCNFARNSLKNYAQKVAPLDAVSPQKTITPNEKLLASLEAAKQAVINAATRFYCNTRYNIVILQRPSILKKRNMKIGLEARLTQIASGKNILIYV